MNSMPEPTQTGDSINDNIVEAATAALKAWGVASPEDAVRLLQSWARRPEMTDGDLAAVLDVLFPVNDLPMMDCPDWCTYDHSRERYNDVENLCTHFHDLVVERDDEGRIKLEVSVAATDDLTDRTRTPAGIHVQTDEPLSVGQALQLVGAVAEGLRIIVNA